MSPADAPPTRPSRFLFARATWRSVIRPDFDDDSVNENAKAGFEAIVVDGAGKRIAASGLTYTWVREDTTYQWFQDSNSQWKYQSVTRDRLMTSGTLDIGTGAPARLAQTFPWGTYRLTITDPKIESVELLSLLFRLGGECGRRQAGSHSGGGEQAVLQAGRNGAHLDQARGRRPALVVVAGDRIYSSQMIDAPASGASIDIPVSADWGAGAYVLVTDYRALNDATGREPVRSIGVAWLGVDNSARTLTPLIGGPDKITPRQRITIPVVVKGLDERRSGLSDPGRGRRRHSAAHRFQIAGSRHLLFRQAPPRRRHA